jgi:hypothetical protein
VEAKTWCQDRCKLYAQENFGPLHRRAGRTDGGRCLAALEAGFTLLLILRHPLAQPEKVRAGDGKRASVHPHGEKVSLTPKRKRDDPINAHKHGYLP